MPDPVRTKSLGRGRAEWYFVEMRHRHLIHEDYTLAAIDDIISRGRWNDWSELRDAARADPKVLERITRVCIANAGDPYAQRYFFWMNYAKEHRSAA
ncbi:hypothetical protein [Acidiphilium sp. C61]|uniref:hypothetical protein n=1 Tax=Acidiphilium sp. C61 TaxID=1671485 RepID=UPI00191997D2|nr:hypothetical protein [Acidiphilium sp. C61]